MKTLAKLVSAAKSPVEGVIHIFSTGLLLYASYLLSPWYEPNYVTAVSAGLQNNAEVGLAILYVVCSAPGIIAPFFKNKTRTTLLKLASFGVFLSFLFLAVLRITLLGWLPLTWLPPVMISLASGYLHIWLEVTKE